MKTMLFMRESKYKIQYSIAFVALLIIGIGIFFFSQSSITVPDETHIVTVTIPDGLRKEQTARMLTDALDWSKDEEWKFVVEDTARDILHVEGVFPGGTYQISTASSTYEVASMFLDRSNERYRNLGSGLSPEEWYETLKVAAIAEREASTSTEMESIARDIWQNRYRYLQSDATVQYVKDTMQMYANEACDNGNTTSGMVEYHEYVGNSGGAERTVCIHWRLAYIGADQDFDWWQPITEADKELRHGYNTYLYKGLPQHPIATPSENAIATTLSSRN